MWIAGAHFSFTSLARVRLTAHLPVLRFHYRVQIEEVSSWNMRVLVPRAHEAEAERLAQRIQTEVIDAMKQQIERWNNPPEPRL